MIKRIVAALAVLAVTVVGTPTVAQAEPYACWNTGCDGLTPNLVPYCWNDRVTLWGSNTPVGGGIYIQLIYSPSCGAIWAHHTAGSVKTIRVQAYDKYTWALRASYQVTTQGYEPWRNSRMVGAIGYAVEGGYIGWWGGPGLCGVDWVCTPSAQL